MAINKVAVIGSGVMGSGIAAQVANADIPVVLLDIVPDGTDDRSMLANNAVARMLKTEPAAFMHKRNAKLVQTGNLEDDLELLGDCDWIIEVVLEDLNVKHETYKKIDAYRKKGSIVSSNTSTIPLQNLVAPLGDDFAKDFLITHFFNPPRYMRLLELVVGDKTRSDAVSAIREFCDIRLGKGVVNCHDTPGFIANRLGIFWLEHAVNVAIDMGLSVEEADAVMSKPVGIPKTGVFGLLDLVGIDLIPHMAKSLLSTLPEQDRYRDLHKENNLILQMIKAGYTGRKGKGGFYRLNKTPDGKKQKQALDISQSVFAGDDSYQAAQKPKLESVAAAKNGLRAVVETADKGGQYAWAVLSEVLAYAASLVPEIADDVYAVDEAMKLGYNWKMGPFEMIDAMGPAWFAEKLAAEKKPVPEFLAAVGDRAFYKVEHGALHYFGVDGTYQEIKRPDGVMLLRDLKLSAEPVYKTDSAALWDIGDSVLCLEFTGKMNALDLTVFDVMHKAVEIIGDGSGDYRALVVYNEGSIFSAGANLGLAVEAMKEGNIDVIKALIAGGQKAYMALKMAPFPVVVAPSGMALGGGCEIILHGDHVQSHAELYCGLVEVGVGLIPGWGGCKEMILRYQEEERENYVRAMAVIGQKRLWFSPPNTPMGAVRKAFQLIGMATVAKSAEDAKSLRYLRKGDGITMNRDRLLFDAKQAAIKLAQDYQVPELAEDIRLPGPSGKVALDMAVDEMRKSGKATPYDVVVSGALSAVLSGGDIGDWTQPVNENDLLDLEIHEFMKLVHNDGTRERIEHMLGTGKPLRN